MNVTWEASIAVADAAAGVALFVLLPRRGGAQAPRVRSIAAPSRFSARILASLIFAALMSAFFGALASRAARAEEPSPPSPIAAAPSAGDPQGAGDSQGAGDRTGARDAAEGAGSARSPGAVKAGTENAANEKAGPEQGGDAKKNLVGQEQQVADHYRHLEEVLLKMAEVDGAADPRRAALLRRAIGRSKERLIAVQFDRVVDLLDKDQLSRAMEGQGELHQELQALLDLLTSEDRAKQVEDQKRRLREYLQRLGGLIALERELLGRTQDGRDAAAKLAEEQAKAADETRKLAGDIRQNEEKASNGAKAPSQEGKQEADKNPPADSTPKNPPKDGATPGGAEKANGARPPSGSESPKSRGANPAPSGEPNEKPAADGDESSNEQEGNANPARKRLDAAEERMRDAEKKLAEAERAGAAEDQQQALRELQLAKEELEKILRQLREEEIERRLAMLESRFRKMLAMQREVYEGTVRLDKVPAAARAQDHEIECGRLSGQESKIVTEVDRAMLLLREDGTAVVFPEVIGQIREDMLQVVQRLAQTRVDAITQQIELDILGALEEMIDALKKAQQEQQRRRGQPQQGEPAEPPLVDVLSELKMIRAMQVRVNARTERYSKLVDGEQADKADVLEALRRLAEQQRRIYRVTRELELRRNES